MEPRLPATPAYILGWLSLFLAGLTGAVLLIVADFSTLRGVRAVAVDLDRTSAGGHHGYVLLLAGLVGVALCARALLRRGPGAMAGLALAGLAALLVALAVDLPVLGSVAPFDQYYALTIAWNGDALELELMGACLLLLSGCGQLWLYARRPRVPQARPAPAAAA